MMTTEAKVVESIAHMIENIDLATEVTSDGDETYFRFNGHLFSIIRRHESSGIENYVFFIYPQWTSPIRSLINSFEQGFDDSIEYANFNAATMSDPNAMATMKRLYNELRSQALGIDRILDDVLQTRMATK